MNKDMKYQIRLYLTDAFAQAARADARDPQLKSVNDILDKHGLKMENQFDALVGFCQEAEASSNTDNALYRWTKSVIEQPIKEAKYSKQFTLYALNDDQVYDKAIAERAASELQSLLGGGIISKIEKYDDNKDTNPQAPEQFR